MNKDYILKEIARTAKENNGVPLGQMRFAKETGIKICAWKGKFWARWSDAIIEVGLTPNKMQPAYEEKFLIEQIIAFIREIKEFPTVAELQLKANNTPDFPGYRAIWKRLGTKSRLASKIINYCEGHPEFADVRALCKDVPCSSEKEPLPYSKGYDVEHGYVYLMKSGRFYKIGCSKNVERRNYDLGIKLPENLNISHKIATDDPSGMESYWHNRFKDKRKKGEWFDLSKEDISAFKRRKFM
jgi:hypothetical protein